MAEVAAIAGVRSGGQTGVDRAALDVARMLGIPTGGWCPSGGWAEDATQAPGICESYPELRETPSADTSQRTEWNVRDATATLIFMPFRSVTSEGTDLAFEAARSRARPCLLVCGAEQLPVAAEWLAGLGDGIELNIAGPRESECPGAYAMAWQFLWQLLPAFSRPPRE